MIEIIEINSFEKLAPYGTDWNRLLENSDTNVVFLTYEFCRSWWETQGKEGQLLVLLAKHDSELVGIAPLAIVTRRRFGFRTRVVEFLAAIDSDYADFILDSSEREVVLSAFLRHLWSIRHRWDVLVLRQIPERSSTIELSRSYLTASRIPFRTLEAVPCPTILLKERGPEVQQRMHKDRTARKSRNRLKKMGEVAFGFATNVEEGLEYVECMLQQHITRWEGTLTPSTFLRKSEQDFYRRLVRYVMPRGWLRVGYLNLNRVPIAIFVGFEYAGSMSAIRISFDRYYEKQSPGKLLIEDSVAHCLEKDLLEFDLLAGMEAYKKHRANFVWRNYSLLIYKSAARRVWDTLTLRLRNSRLASPLFRSGKLFDFRIRLRKYRGRYGTWGMVKKALHRFISPLIDYKAQLVFEWDGEEFTEQKPRCPLEIRPGSEDDLPLIAGLYGWTADSPNLENIRQKLAQGDRLYLGFSGKTCVHVQYSSRRPKIYEPSMAASWELEEDQGWIYGCRTSFVFRRNNINTVVMQRTMRNLVEDGVKRVVISCYTTNCASAKAIQKAGFRVLTTVRVLKLFGRKIGSKTVKVG